MGSALDHLSHFAGLLFFSEGIGEDTGGKGVSLDKTSI